MYVKIVAPIVAVVFLAIQAVTGITISEEIQNEIVGSISNIIAIGFVVYGVFTDAGKKKKAE